jgi:hypothetical protein
MVQRSSSAVSSSPAGFACGELFERFDGLLWVGHRVELVLDAMSRALESGVVKEHANGVAS